MSGARAPACEVDIDPDAGIGAACRAWLDDHVAESLFLPATRTASG